MPTPPNKPMKRLIAGAIVLLGLAACDSNADCPPPPAKWKGAPLVECNSGDGGGYLACIYRNDQYKYGVARAGCHRAMQEIYREEL